METFPCTEWIWADGEFVRWRDATVHVMAHGLHYGSSVFEGVRAYPTPRGAMFFRLREHLERLRDSASIHRMELPWSLDDLEAASKELVTKNGLDDCYFRPLVFRGVGAAGLDPIASPVRVFLIAWPWGTYLGHEALEDGVDCCVSSWTRPAPNTHPTMAKAGGNYINGSLMKMEARRNGFSEAIALTVTGTVSEGSGQNIFVVKGGRLHTPAVDGTFLQGITRDSILTLARDMGIEVREGTIPREALYVADEIFMAGTASEVVPVRSVDRSIVGEGKRGPITERIQERFMTLVRGASPDPYGWVTPATLEPAAVGR